MQHFDSSFRVDPSHDSVAIRMAALPMAPGLLGRGPRSPSGLLRCIQRERPPGKRRPPFAALAFEVGDPAVDCNRVEWLVHAFRTRARTGDAIGWCGRLRTGLHAVPPAIPSRDSPRALRRTPAPLRGRDGLLPARGTWLCRRDQQVNARAATYGPLRGHGAAGGWLPRGIVTSRSRRFRRNRWRSWRAAPAITSHRGRVHSARSGTKADRLDRAPRSTGLPHTALHPAQSPSRGLRS